MSFVYLDACALIDAREKQTVEAQALINLIAEGSADKPFVTSDLSLIEVLIQPIRGLTDRLSTHADSLPGEYYDWYLGNLVPDGVLIRTVPVDRDVLIQAALLRARIRSLKTPDAIHAATAYKLGCTHFVTGDDKLIRSIQNDEGWLTTSKRFAFVALTVEALDELRRLLAS